MVAAMKAKDKVALTAIRGLKTAISNAEKESSDTVTEQDVISIVRKQVKQRLDSISQYEQAGRPDLAKTEQDEIEILEKYLPTPLTEEEISKIVSDTVSELGASSMADMGKVMKAAQEKSAERADGKILSQAVKSALS